MKSLSIDTHPHDPAVDEELYKLLKEAEDTTPATSTGDDEGESTVGVNPNQYPDPEDRPTGDADAPWGEDPGDSIDNSTEVMRSFRQSREKILDDLFDGKGSSDGTEQAVMGQHLTHASSGDFETSSPQLSAKAKESSVKPETLLEMTRRIAGRH